MFDKLISFLTISSVFIAINCLLLVYFSFLLYSINIDFNLLLSSFLVTFSVYSLDKLSSIKEDSICLKDRVAFISRYKKTLTYITVAFYVAALSLAFLKNLLALFVVLFPLFAGLIYSIKISSFRLKDIIGIKNITIALSWSLIGTFLPLAVSFSDFIHVFSIFYFFFVRVFIGSILFDVRDIEGDSMNGVRTIPVVLGRNATKEHLLILNSTLIPWFIFSYSHGYFHRYIFVLIFAIVYGYGHIFYFCREGIKIGKSLDLLVDGEWIPIVILALIFKKIPL